MCLRRLFCKHDYQILKTYTDDGDRTIGYRATEFCIVYCAKCKHQKTITKLSYEVMREMQRIDNEYENSKRNGLSK